MSLAIKAQRRPVGLLARLGWSGQVGLLIILVFTLMGLSSSWIAPHDPAIIAPAHSFSAPSWDYPLGTDNLGRCLLSRLLYGTRLSLGTAALATLIITVLGVTVGAISGYYGGWLDGVLMRLVDILLAFPSLIIALAIVGTLGPGLVNAMIGLVCVWWVGYARILRGLVLACRTQPYVEAAHALGAGHGRILWRHILPNVVSPVLVLVTLELGQLILALAGLNFLGLGAQPPTPEWGSMLNAGRPFLQTAPQLMIYPGVTIAIVVLGFNLLGDSLRDLLDPYLRGKGALGA
ncbi:MAG: ABC transporter permease subunit [Caldilineaceae bacterium]|nr:ABC transporter permease subunit [Caldilineaceae bacterium]